MLYLLTESSMSRRLVSNASLAFVRYLFTSMIAKRFRQPMNIRSSIKFDMTHILFSFYIYFNSDSHLFMGSGILQDQLRVFPGRVICHRSWLDSDYFSLCPMGLNIYSNSRNALLKAFNVGSLQFAYST